MTNLSSNHKNIKQLLRQTKFPELLKNKIRSEGYSLSTFSTQIGKHSTYFQRQADNYDHQVSLLIAISIGLQSNMLEPFVNVLPEGLRITQREKDLNLQIDDLKKQLADLGKERDIYKNIVLQNR